MIRLTIRKLVLYVPPETCWNSPFFTSVTYKAARTDIVVLLHGEIVALSVLSLEQLCMLVSVEVVHIWVRCMLVPDVLQPDTTNCVKTSSQAGHCAKSRKVACSISDGVISTVHWHNASGRSMVLVSTEPLSEYSTSPNSRAAFL
jgi:hypothetical protein